MDTNIYNKYLNLPFFPVMYAISFRNMCCTYLYIQLKKKCLWT